MSENGISGERVGELVVALTEALGTVVQDQQVSEAEWYAALEFLGEVAGADELILLSDVLGLSVVVDRQEHAERGGTATNVLGPFWRPAPELTNPGTLAPEDADGEALVVSGMVRNHAGDPVADDPWPGNDVISADVPDLTVPIDRSTTPASATFDLHLAPTP